MTRGEEIIAAFAEAIHALKGLSLQHYEDAEVRVIVERLGGRVERFFKTAVFVDATAKDDFGMLIGRLKRGGASKEVR